MIAIFALTGLNEFERLALAILDGTDAQIRIQTEEQNAFACVTWLQGHASGGGQFRAFGDRGVDLIVENEIILAGGGVIVNMTRIAPSCRKQHPVVLEFATNDFGPAADADLLKLRGIIAHFDPALFFGFQIGKKIGRAFLVGDRRLLNNLGRYSAPRSSRSCCLLV